MNKRIKDFKSTSRKRLQSLSFAGMLPNFATVMALCIGLTSVRFAYQERYEMAVAAILIAAVLDGMDGRLARLLGASSDFGAELDSLSDFISFGVAPAVVLYFTTMHAWTGIGWGIVLLFAVCSAFRLARFNIARNTPQPDAPPWTSQFFTGVPAPAGAMVALLPMIATFATDIQVFLSPMVSAFFLVVSGLLMISRLPTFSLKAHQIPRKFAVPMMLAFGLGIVTLLSDPWTTMAVVVLGYIVTIPLAWISYGRLKRAHKTS